MPTVFERIMAYNKDRIPELVKLKYHFISEDIFRFYRGTCHLFYEDLSANSSWTDTTRTWICGDLHLENYGSYKGDNRVVYFDLNDFDESILAPATWELVRVLTSIYIAAQSVPYTAKTAGVLSKLFMESYLTILRKGKPVVIEKETAEGLLKSFLQQLQLRKEKAFVQTRIITKKGQPRLLIDNQKTIALDDKPKQKLLQQMNEWFAKNDPSKKVQVLDAAHRIAGTGSVGIQRYVLLLREKKTGKLRLADLKEAKPSSVQPYSTLPQPWWKNEAERVTEIQRRMQHVSPALLNTVRIGKTYFVLKELQPTADRMNLAVCKGSLDKLSGILTIMAEATASAQLRSAGRQGSSIADELIDFATQYKPWKKALLSYAKQYAQKVQDDYTSYCKDYAAAIKEKRI